MRIEPVCASGCVAGGISLIFPSAYHQLVAGPANVWSVAALDRESYTHHAGGDFVGKALLLRVNGQSLQLCDKPQHLLAACIHGLTI